MKTVAFAVFLAALVPASMVSAQSQSADRAIRLVAPFPPGGGVDNLARLIAPAISEKLGQPVIVENRPGAGGNIGAEYVVHAAADGATLLIAGNNIPINAVFNPNSRFNPATDLTPVSLVATAPMVFATALSLPASVQELIARAKANPGWLNFATPGNGTPHHLAGELFARQAGISMATIHYKGTPPALTDLLSGETHLTVATLSAVHAHLANGRLRAIAVASENRTSLMSDVPTVSEAGLTGYRADLWYAIFAPKATPGAVVERLNHAIVAALNEPQVREGLRAQGYEITPSSAQALAELMHEDVKLYRALQKDGNVKVQ